jgi:hypothetical protein
MNTDTPRTDDFDRVTNYELDERGLNFARTLERELAAAQAEVVKWREMAERLAELMVHYRLNVEVDAPADYSDALATYRALKGEQNP